MYLNTNMFGSISNTNSFQMKRTNSFSFAFYSDAHYYCYYYYYSTTKAETCLGDCESGNPCTGWLVARRCILRRCCSPSEMGLCCERTPSASV